MMCPTRIETAGRHLFPLMRKYVMESEGDGLAPVLSRHEGVF